MALPVFSAFAPSALAERRDVAVDHVAFRIIANEDALAAFVRPGQFVKMRVRAEDEQQHEGIFALASAPSERRLSFIVRTRNPEGGEAADRIAELSIGAPIEVTLPAGEGFALERAEGHDVALIAAGTAIAPVRSAMEVILASRAKYGAISVDYGLRSLAHLPIREDVDRWRARGIDVRLHLSSPRADGTIDGVLAHVAYLTRVGARARDQAIIAVGHSAMVREVRERVGALGGDPGLVLHNY
jgi:NAD(P)H-flavin reductase